MRSNGRRTGWKVHFMGSLGEHKLPQVIRIRPRHRISPSESTCCRNTHASPGRCESLRFYHIGICSKSASRRVRQRKGELGIGGRLPNKRKIPERPLDNP